MSTIPLNVRIEWDTAPSRKLRTRNKLYYRILHWPLWITVYFLVPGPLIFDLFERGLDWRIFAWLGTVLAGTGIAGRFAQLPGVERAPYIIVFTEDRPNPLYRRVCYTFAWSAVITYAILNYAGLIVAVVSNRWILKQIYRTWYFPLAGTVLALGAAGKLPRVLPSTKGEGYERRYFYGSVWAVTVAQPLVGLLWVTLPKNRVTNIIKLVTFTGVLGLMGFFATRGWLPRTQAILPGQSAIAD